MIRSEIYLYIILRTRQFTNVYKCLKIDKVVRFIVNLLEVIPGAKSQDWAGAK